MLKIGITGGIGSGKSVVCEILSHMGFAVYNADRRAKWLIANNPELIAKITQLLGPEAYTGGNYNTTYVAKRVFDNKSMLLQLNALVHPAVNDDFIKWTQDIAHEHSTTTCCGNVQIDADKHSDKTSSETQNNTQTAEPECVANELLQTELPATETNSMKHKMMELTANQQLVFVEAALLIESQLHQLVDRIVLVTAPDELRIHRVMRRDKVDRQQVLKRMENQMSTYEMLQHAHFVIINDERELLLPRISGLIHALTLFKGKRAEYFE